MVGPLCGHEGPAVAQVSKETGIPLVMDAAGADNVTKWDRTPTVVRTAVSSSQIGHPFGDYLYKELGAAQRHLHRPGLHLGPRGDARRRCKTFKELGGKVAKLIWNPIGTKDYGTTIASIPADSDAVVAIVVGADRIRLFEAWFNFGMDKKFKIYGGYWMQEDVLPQMDDRAIGMIGNSLHYAAGLDTPENKAFVDALRQEVQAAAVVVRRVGLHRRPVDEDRDRRDQGQRRGQGRVPQGDAHRRDQGAARTAQARRLRQPDPERLHLEDPEDQTSGARRRADQRAGQDLRGGVAVLDLEAGGVPEARTLQAVIAAHRSPGGASRRRAAGASACNVRHLMHSAILQAINGISLRGAAVPARQRLHADLRPDARRQHGARRLLSARRLYRTVRSPRYTGSFALGVLGGGLADRPARLS